MGVYWDQITMTIWFDHCHSYVSGTCSNITETFARTAPKSHESAAQRWFFRVLHGIWPHDISASSSSCGMVRQSQIKGEDGRRCIPNISAIDYCALLQSLVWLGWILSGIFHESLTGCPGFHLNTSLTATFLKVRSLSREHSRLAK